MTRGFSVGTPDGVKDQPREASHTDGKPGPVDAVFEHGEKNNADHKDHIPTLK